MTRDEILSMAREAGGLPDPMVFLAAYERFAEMVEARATAAEREACAKVCDTTPPYPFRPSIEAAHAIRARSKT